MTREAGRARARLGKLLDDTRRAADTSARRALLTSVGASHAWALVWVAAGLGVSWTLTYLFGGAGTVVPHWFYLPVIFAAVRLGHLGAFVVAVLAGILAGPMSYQYVATATHQQPSEWFTRMAFFVVAGQLIAWMMRHSLQSVAQELSWQREERRLRQALEDGELTLRYQPIVDTVDGRMVGTEALLRWDHPADGELAPGAFLPVAERSHIIHEIGGFVLDTACAQTAEWSRQRRARGEPALMVSVNLSGRELSSATVSDRIADALAASGLEPGQLCIEITESALIEDVARSVAHLQAVKSLGVQIAVDDFGTGYSSLAYVQQFPLDVLKIDRSFVAALDGAQGDALVGGIVMLARSLGLVSVAEGVEDRQQAEAVRRLDCDLAQGFYFARPQSADAVTALMSRPPHAGGAGVQTRAVNGYPKVAEPLSRRVARHS